ncbi:MAG TPA: zinc ABC transporter substrate-binding protein [Spirochaetota bacterium]|nr:zinc ABC transporter substrate-binding protein [Spirochaetota bacterium]
MLPKIIVVFFLLISIFGCKKQSTDDKKINIITTIFPLYDFVKEVGKDKVDVSILLPPGSEAHSFEPTPKDIIKINESAMFVYIGESMEPWARKIVDSIRNKNLTILETEKVIEVIEESEHEEEHHRHNGKDPHIWLDFEIDQKIVNKIVAPLKKLSDIDYKINFSVLGYNLAVKILKKN